MTTTIEQANACDHPEFVVDATVARLSKTEGGPITAFTVDVTVKCAKCNAPFRWLGLSAGSSPSHPMTSVDGRELRAPIAPEGMEADLSIPGFTIRQRGVQ